MVTAAQTALDDAENLSADQMASLQTMIDEIDTSDLETQETRVAEAETKATTAAAATKKTVIAAEAAQTTDAGLGGTDATIGTAEGNYSLDIERDREATTITVTVHGATDAADENFMGDQPGEMLTRTMDADGDGNVMTEVVIVYTDIQAPRAVEFAKFEIVAADGTSTTPQALNVSTDTTNDTPTATNEALGIIATNIGMVKASAFTAPTGTVGTTILSFQHAVADDTGTTEVDESRDAAEIAGTFNGSMGTYRCVATAACTVTVNTMGVVSAVSTDNDWAFIPAAGATTDQPDYDYYHYGFWLKRTADDDGVITYNEVETFAGSSLDASGSVAAVEGSATYEGGAAGVYVREVYKSTTDPSIDTATSGAFTADAELNATFGQITTGDNANSIPPNMLNRLTGTIDNFMLSGGEENTWSVSLQGAAGNIDTGTGTASGAAQGGGDAGTWSATFHGVTSRTVDTTTTNFAPDSVVGEFNANFGNGLVAGAFGARKQ